MKKIFLSLISFVALINTNALANGFDDVMQSKSSKQSTDKSQATSRQSPSSHHGSADARQAQLNEFVAVNSDQLAKEIAMGQGETLNTLIQLLEVEKKEAFVAKLQKNYSKIYSNKEASSSSLLENISKI